MKELTKKQKQIARKLVGLAYERELYFHLEKLAQQFDGWRENKIDSFSLNDLIHEHHDGISRELFKIYHYHSNLLLLLERAMNAGFLNRDEVPVELIAQ